MGELIDSLLIFSRMGRAEMLHTRVDLNGLVRQAQRDVMQAEPERLVEWVIRPLPTVPGDPNMLQLVFTNLLSNAFKYSRTRETRDHRSGQRAMDRAARFVVYVKDNGVGFDMAYARSVVRCLSAPASRRRVRRNGYWTGQRAAHRPAPRRARVGGKCVGRGRDVLCRAAEGATVLNSIVTNKTAAAL